MIFGLADGAYADYTPPEDPAQPKANPLDAQIEALKLEIKTIEHEIQVHQAAQQIDEEASTEKKQKEIADLTRQVQSFQRSLEHEQKRVKHFETEIAKKEGKYAEQQQQLATQPDSEFYDEQAAALKAQNEQLEQELKDLHKDIANEVGEDFDIDELLKSGGTSKQRAEKLQRLNAECAKLKSQAVDYRVKSAVEGAADKVNKGLDQLLERKAQLEVSNETMRNKINRSRTKCDELEEESRALRMMDVLLAEKLKHDDDLIKHLEQIQGQNPNRTELPEEETPPVTEELVAQLRAQQNIVKGLLYKLGLAQRELAEYTVPAAFEYLVDQLNQLNHRCMMLQKNLLKREAAETAKIEQHIGEE